MRISKYLAAAGACSRREAESLIERGRIKLNGSVVTTPVTFISENDEVSLDNRTIRPIESRKIWAFYKPASCITSRTDPEGRETIYDILPPSFQNIKYVGRLDYASEGLLLMTNDGALVRHLELPKYQIPRTYKVRVYGVVPEEMIQRLALGLNFEGVQYQSTHAEIGKKEGRNVWIKMILKEGKNREIRNMMTFFDLKVNRLIRDSFGPVTLGDLKPGEVKSVDIDMLDTYLKEK